MNSLPFCIELTLACDTMNIHFEGDAWQLVKCFPIPVQFLFNFTKDSHIPILEVDLGLGAIIQNWKLCGQCLSRWQPPFIFELLFDFLSFADTYKYPLFSFSISGLIFKYQVQPNSG